MKFEKNIINNNDAGMVTNSNCLIAMAINISSAFYVPCITN